MAQGAGTTHEAGPWRRALLCVVALALSSGGSSAAWAAAGIADRIEGLTGGKRVKVVWARQEKAEENDQGWGVESSNHTLWGYDTDDDTVRQLRTEWDAYDTPLITHTGKRIVFSDKLERKVKVVNWDGSNLKTVVDGWSHVYWYDANSGKEWVYYAEKDNPSRLNRINLNNTGEKQLVWKHSEIDYGSISSDGKRIAACWPWPDQCGVVVPKYDGSGDGTMYSDLTGHYAKNDKEGCWPTITPDTTYRFAVFDTPHRTWRVWKTPTSSETALQLHTCYAEMPTDGAVYHPRYSNNPRFIVLTGPYWKGVELNAVYLGKTASDLSQVSDWVRITSHTSQREKSPDAWVQPAAPIVGIDRFDVSPGSVHPGKKASLSWSTSNATEVRIDPGVGKIAGNGSVEVSPGVTTTYKLTAQGPGGPREAQIKLVVIPLRNADNPTDVVAGLDVSYFELDAPEALPDFSALSAYQRDTVDKLDFAKTDGVFASSGRGEGIGAVFAGFVSVPTDGVYTFFLTSDEGSSLSVGNEVLIESQGPHGMTETSGSIGLRAGKHAIRVDFYEGSGAAGLVMRYSGPGVSKQVVPASALFRLAATDSEDPAVTIDSPKEGTLVSDSVAVEGSARDNVGVVSIDLRIDDGDYVPSGETAQFSTELATGTLVEGDHRIRVRACDAAGNCGAKDVTVVVDRKPRIEIIAPTQGDIWAAQTTQVIVWRAHNLTDARILFSVDDGETWDLVEGADSIGDRDATWQAFPWEVPDTPSDSCLVMIQGYDGEVPTRSAVFSIATAQQGSSDAGTRNSNGPGPKNGPAEVLVGGCATGGRVPAQPIWFAWLALLAIGNRIRRRP